MKDLPVPQFKQETEYGCIPACLQQVFAYYNKQISQKEILNSLGKPERGMSIPAAGAFVKKRGLNPTIVTNNTTIFDSAWFNIGNKKLMQRLEERKNLLNEYNQSVVEDYIEYLRIEGQINFDTISKDLLTKNLSKNVPIIIELSRGIKGHGVVIAGFDKNKFKIIDPDPNNPYDKSGIYWIPAEELLMSFSILEGRSLLSISGN